MYWEIKDRFNMIPKKIRRTIIVNGEEWEYCITGKYCADVFLHNLKNNAKIKWYAEGEGIAVKPSDIRSLIENKKLFGIKAR